MKKCVEEKGVFRLAMEIPCNLKFHKRLTSNELGQLGKLAGDSKIDALVTKFDQDTAQDIGLDLVGDQQLLAFGQVALLQSIDDLVQGSLVQFLECVVAFWVSRTYVSMYW